MLVMRLTFLSFTLLSLSIFTSALPTSNSQLLTMGDLATTCAISLVTRRDYSKLLAEFRLAMNKKPDDPKAQSLAIVEIINDLDDDLDSTCHNTSELNDGVASLFRDLLEENPMLEAEVKKMHACSSQLLPLSWHGNL
ncbi:hypothetical protein H0H93_001106 [Arthromyces matolae]|nr:hypothetical protein H0H93_001106 [Arthromyces matolae]